jgi:very-short-patch-repair endonuclease
MRKYIKNLNLTNFARNNRKESTKAEKIIWNLIRNKKMGIAFRRQHQIGKYIVDFISLEKKLIIEIDGGQHNEERNINYDEERTMFLNSNGFKVLRFWNNDILENLEGVHSVLAVELTRPLLNPPPDKVEEIKPM